MEITKKKKKSYCDMGLHFTYWDASMNVLNHFHTSLTTVSCNEFWLILLWYLYQSSLKKTYKEKPVKQR